MLLSKEKVKLLHVVLYSLSERRNVQRWLLLQFLPIAVDKDKEINYLVSYNTCYFAPFFFSWNYWSIGHIMANMVL